MDELPKINEFIKKLKKQNDLIECVNQYSVNTLNSNITINNLKLYLNNIYNRKPKCIFIGEAPGYKGCRVTGVPFTAEFNISQNYKDKLFGINNGYRIVNIENPYEELSANTVWQYFKNSKFTPFFWNAFPFHPHKPNNLNSNRKPNAKELAIGYEYLRDLVNIFDIEHYVSIGRSSQNILRKNNINCEYLRHPSHGGNILFENKMRELENKMSLTT